MHITFLILLFCAFFRNALQIYECRVSGLYSEENEPCFEMPSRYEEPDRLKEHIDRLRGIAAATNRRGTEFALPMGELSNYMDTVITPHMTTYYTNIDNNNQMLARKSFSKIKSAINNAVIRKTYIYNNLTALANELNISKICDYERRLAKTLASEHVAKTYECTETVRQIVDKVAKYTNEIMSIIKGHMDDVVFNIAHKFETRSNVNVTSYIKQLSRAAVRFGYELDLCLTNARRQSEMAADKLTNCKTNVKRYTESMITNAEDELYHCVYA